MPKRIFAVTGFLECLTIALTYLYNFLGSLSQDEPAPLVVTFLTGQPKLRSKKSYLIFNSLLIISIAFKVTSILLPNNCSATGRSNLEVFK